MEGLSWLQNFLKLDSSSSADVSDQLPDLLGSSAPQLVLLMNSVTDQAGCSDTK